MRYNIKTVTFKLTYSALLIAVGVLLPQAFHIVNFGRVMLPMHLSVMLAGLLLGAKYGGFVGFLTPLLSSMLFGMPNMPMLPIMLVELTLYGFTIGLVHRKLNALPSLLIAMVIGRIGYAITFYTLIYVFGLKIPIMLSVWSAIATGIFGILTQIVLVPILYNLFQRTFISEYK